MSRVVDLRVGINHFHVGDPAVLHALVSTVGARLEPDGPGTRFPRLQGLDDGGVPGGEPARQAARELQAATAELEALPPSAIVWDRDDPSATPPWGDEPTDWMANLAEAFIARDNVFLLGKIEAALREAAAIDQPLEIVEDLRRRPDGQPYTSPRSTDVMLVSGLTTRLVGPSDAMTALFTTIAEQLEPGGWGTRFPCLMRELYEGRLEHSAIVGAERELVTVRAELDAADRSHHLRTVDGADLLEMLAAAITDAAFFGAPVEITTYRDHLARGRVDA